ncbi:uncharacterized protein [Lepisosteus oculatus]|uniref:uncharacterized protein n=1 Tax=Lepisosteus oculatus TaxID=7918 RepID=UPI0035F52915
MAQSKLTSELQCPVCLGLFSDPVTLPCDHTFCRGCLESYLATDVAVHLCPQCRAPIPRRDYRTNRVLRNMADRARQEEEKVSEQTDLLCVEHDEKLKLYCETDGTLICLVCRDSSSHRGHGFKPVQEAAREFRESLLAAQKAVKEDVAARESLRDRQQEHIASRKENHRALKTQLSAQFEELRQMLMKKEEEEEQYMDEKETLKLRPMERNLEAIERELRESREKAKAIKTGLDTTETHRFLEWWCKGGYSTANREKTAFSSDRSGSLCVIPDSLTVSPAESLEKHIDWRGLQSSIRRDIRKGSQGSWNLSQQAMDTRRGSLWTGHQRGSGKSSAGNTILGRKEFKTSLTSRAVTTECQRAETQIDGRPVAVIDTPDFFDQACPDPGAQSQRCLDLSAPGAHVFLLVLQLGRFSDGEKEMVRQIKEKLGSGSLIMVLFTHGDELRNQTIQQFLLNSDPELRKLVRQCGGWFHLFDNTVEGDRSQVTSLLEEIDIMSAVVILVPPQVFSEHARHPPSPGGNWRRAHVIPALECLECDWASPAVDGERHLNRAPLFTVIADDRVGMLKVPHQPSINAPRCQTDAHDSALCPQRAGPGLVSTWCALCSKHVETSPDLLLSPLGTSILRETS